MSTETTLTTTTRVTVTVDYSGEQYSAVVTRRPDAAGVGYVYDVDWLDDGGHDEDRALNNMAVDAFLAEVPEP